MPRRRLLFATFGVPISLAYPRELDERVSSLLPPQRSDAPGDRQPMRFELIQRPGDVLQLTADDIFITQSTDLDLVLDILDSELRNHIAGTSRGHTFIHAGAVAIGGRALLLPGRSFAGKSTLVGALLRAGAEYMSDEFAVLEPNGEVVPYPRPISLRIEGRSMSRDLDPGLFGPHAQASTYRVGWVIATTYVPGTVWNPVPLTPGTAALRLFENAVSAEAHPEETLRAIRAAVAGARGWEGPRGDADETARQIFEAIRG